MKLWVFLLIMGVLLAGWVECVFKAVNCDWEAPYKAEAIYTTSVIIGIGCIVGWIDIEDGPTKVTDPNS